MMKKIEKYEQTQVRLFFMPGNFCELNGYSQIDQEAENERLKKDLKGQEETLNDMLQQQANERTKKSVKRAAKQLVHVAAKKRASSPPAVQVKTRSKTANKNQ